MGGYGGGCQASTSGCSGTRNTMLCSRCLRHFGAVWRLPGGTGGDFMCVRGRWMTLALLFVRGITD